MGREGRCTAASPPCIYRMQGQPRHHRTLALALVLALALTLALALALALALTLDMRLTLAWP